MFMNKKAHYCQDVNSFQIDLQIQGNPNQSPSKLFCGYSQTYSKDFMEKQKTQNSQHDIEREEQIWRTDTTRLQNLLYSHSNQNRMLLVKNRQIDQWN